MGMGEDRQPSGLLKSHALLIRGRLSGRLRPVVQGHGSKVRVQRSCMVTNRTSKAGDLCP